MTPTQFNPFLDSIRTLRFCHGGWAIHRRHGLWR